MLQLPLQRLVEKSRLKQVIRHVRLVPEKTLELGTYMKASDLFADRSAICRTDVAAPTNNATFNHLYTDHN